MPTAVSIAGASALDSSLQGLHRSSARLQGSAETVLSASVSALNGTPDSAGDTVTISDAALQLRGEGSLEQGLLDGKVAGLVYTANAKVVQGADEVAGTLMSIVA